MGTIRIQLDDLKRSALEQPPDYYSAFISAGIVKNEILTIDSVIFNVLCSKYRMGTKKVQPIKTGVTFEEVVQKINELPDNQKSYRWLKRMSAQIQDLLKHPEKLPTGCCGKDGVTRNKRKLIHFWEEYGPPSEQH